MIKGGKLTVIIVIAAVILFGWYYLSADRIPPIGGNRDEAGCLIVAGYGFSEEVGACIRTFEMTADIMKAAKLAVENAGRGYALTVVSFNSYEEPGAYDIMFERGVERDRKTVYIRNWRVEEPRAIKLFYYDAKKDMDETGNVMCSRAGLTAVDREIARSMTPIQDAVRLLLMGELTPSEREAGITTEYPLSGFSLSGASLKDGILTLTFDDLENRTVGGSCRVGVLWFQIEATAKQFPEVKEVRFLPEEIFQP